MHAFNKHCYLDKTCSHNDLKVDGEEVWWAALDHPVSYLVAYTMIEKYAEENECSA